MASKATNVEIATRVSQSVTRRLLGVLTSARGIERARNAPRRQRRQKSHASYSGGHKTSAGCPDFCQSVPKKRLRVGLRLDDIAA